MSVPSLSGTAAAAVSCFWHLFFFFVFAICFWDSSQLADYFSGGLASFSCYISSVSTLIRHIKTERGVWLFFGFFIYKHCSSCCYYYILITAHNQHKFHCLSRTHTPFEHIYIQSFWLTSRTKKLISWPTEPYRPFFSQPRRNVCHQHFPCPSRFCRTFLCARRHESDGTSPSKYLQRRLFL